MTAQWWQERAQCVGDDPRKYDVSQPTAYGRCKSAEAVAAWMEQGSVCDGCPVLRECAADALQHRDRDVIRAGIPIALTNGTSAAGNSAAMDAGLRSIAAGVPPETVRTVLVSERVARAERTPGHRLYLGATS